MKKFFRVTAFLLGGVVVLIGCLAAYVQVKGVPTYTPQIPAEFKVDVTPATIARGEKIAAIGCMSCHLSDDEQRLSGKRIRDVPKEFGTAYAKNITNDPVKGIGQWTNEELAYFLRTGVRKDGSFAPPYMPKFPLMSDEDLGAVIAFLRSDLPVVQASKREPPECEPSFLIKALCNTVVKPYPFDAAPKATPPIADAVIHGKYLADAVLSCTNCHSADFKTNNELNPTTNKGYGGGGNPLLDLEGNIVRSANITPDPTTGIGNWTAEEFIAAVKYGKARNGSSLRYPMDPKTTLDSAEVRAIFAYLKTIPPIVNAVDRR